jgi:hypothetical protein
VVTNYHRSVQAHLLRVGEEARNIRRGNIRRVFNDKRPRHLFHPVTDASFRYFPDATFETRTGSFYLFEVLDTESRAQSQVVAHVLESFLAPHVLKAVFIVKTQQEAKMVENIVKVVIGNLEDLSRGGLNKRVRFYQVVISETDARSLAKVRRILTEARRDLGIVLRAR